LAGIPHRLQAGSYKKAKTQGTLALVWSNAPELAPGIFTHPRKRAGISLGRCNGPSFSMPWAGLALDLDLVASLPVAKLG